MRKIIRDAIVPYSEAQMYALVDRVEDYAQFLPWCAKTSVFSRSSDEVRASVTVQAMGIEKTFTTHNRLQQNKMIEIRLLDGPFKHLEGFWLFEPRESGCRVLLDLEFEFAGGLLNFAFDPLFHQAASSMVDAFVARAKVCYANEGVHES